MARRRPVEASLARLEAEEALAQADADVHHAFTWGWAPGSSTVRHVHGPEPLPFVGLAYWLPRGLGSLRRVASTVSLNTKPPNGES